MNLIEDKNLIDYITIFYRHRCDEIYVYNQFKEYNILHIKEHNFCYYMRFDIKKVGCFIDTLIIEKKDVDNFIMEIRNKRIMEYLDI